MKLAKYWVRGSGAANGIEVHCRGWSDVSEADARRKADEVSQTVARRIAGGRHDRGEYLYGDRPLPEPVLEEMPGGLITRNSYGCAVLNCASLMFLDIDHEDPAAAPAALDLFSGLRSLFGRTPAAAPVQPSGIVAETETVARRHNLGLRIYRTAAGYRGIVTSLKFRPASDETRKLLDAFQCDPLYVRLCHAQDSFRARITPKPWRCGLAAPAVSFPFEGPREEAEFARWLREYQANSAQNATCHLLHTTGAQASDPELAALIDRHDRETKALTKLPLA